MVPWLKQISLSSLACGGVGCYNISDRATDHSSRTDIDLTEFEIAETFFETSGTNTANDTVGTNTANDAIGNNTANSADSDDDVENEATSQSIPNNYYESDYDYNVWLVHNGYDPIEEEPQYVHDPSGINTANSADSADDMENETIGIQQAYQADVNESMRETSHTERLSLLHPAAWDPRRAIPVGPRPAERGTLSYETPHAVKSTCFVDKDPDWPWAEGPGTQWVFEVCIIAWTPGGLDCNNLGPHGLLVLAKYTKCVLCLQRLCAKEEYEALVEQAGVQEAISQFWTAAEHFETMTDNELSILRHLARQGCANVWVAKCLVTGLVSTKGPHGRMTNIFEYTKFQMCLVGQQMWPSNYSERAHSNGPTSGRHNGPSDPGAILGHEQFLVTWHLVLTLAGLSLFWLKSPPNLAGRQ